jgi:predicted O-methyltransferase YrrM
MKVNQMEVPILNEKSHMINQEMDSVTIMNYQFIKDWTSNASLLVEDNSLDFVFIDADHGYKGCFEDIEKWKSKIKLGGFVTGHDIWMSGIQKAVKEHFGNDYKKYPDHVWIHQKK